MVLGMCWLFIWLGDMMAMVVVCGIAEAQYYAGHGGEMWTSNYNKSRGYGVCSKVEENGVIS